MIEWFVKHATTVFLGVLAITVFGLISYISLPREASPDITIPFVMVATPYSGSNPKDIEGLVTIPMENELSGLRNVKKMTSTSSEGLSVVTLEFEPDVQIEDALQRTRDRVNRARAKIPDDAEQSSIREISFSDIPVLIVTIAGDTDQNVLKGLAEDVEDEVRRIPGVLGTAVAGGLTRQVNVLINPGRLNHYGLSLDDVIGALRSENVNIPGGNISRDMGNVTLRVPQTFTSAQEIERVAVKRIGGKPVFVSDLGRVEDSFATRASYARMNGVPAVSLSVTKRAGSNIVDIADEIKAIVEAHTPKWPEGVYHRVLADQSTDIRNMVTELQNNILTALILVITVLLFFMGTRNSLFVALAIPFSMLISVSLLQLLGFTLNMVVLFSLILALGMLVDNAIVVVENIYRHLELGYSRIDAAIKGTQEVAVAIAASTATTVAAFFPMIFWGGIMGEFMGYLPKTVIIVLISSLFVAICIIPVAASRLMRPVKNGPIEQTGEALTAQQGSLRWRIMMAYKRTLQFSIRFRYASAGLGALALLITMVIYGFANHGTELFANVEPNRAIITVRASEGTELAWTDKVTRQIESILAKESNVDVWVAESGVTGDALGGSSNSTNKAKITVDFQPHQTMAQSHQTPRGESTFTTIKRIREAVSVIAGAEISVEKEEMGPPVGPDIEVIVSGKSFHEVGQYVQRIKRDLGSIEGITEISDNYQVNRPELALRTHRGAAKRVGVSSAVIGNTLRTAVAGTKATTIREGENETDVVVQLAPEYRQDVQSVLSLTLPGREDTSPDTFPIPLSAVASYEMSGGTGPIHHTDQDLAIAIRADVPDNFNTNEIQMLVEQRLEFYRTGIQQGEDTAFTEPLPQHSGLQLPPGFDIQMSGATDDQEETVAFLLWAFGIAIALITIILVTQFDSIALPLIIMGTVVLSLIGVFWGLLLTGTPFGVMMTGIGVISLAGIVVNNAIVLLDYVKQLRKKGASVEEALVQAGMIRFRPVILTAITTILGLIPMAIGVAMEFGLTWYGPIPLPYMRLLIGSQSAGWWGPMAIAVIFGLGFATVLTLIMVPTLYSIIWDMQQLGKRIFRRSNAATAALFLLCAGLTQAPQPTQAADFDEVWAEAKQHNLQLKLLDEQRSVARSQNLQAWSYLSPQLSLHASYTFNQYETALDMSEFMGGITDMLPPGTELDFGEPVIVQPKRFFSGGLSITQPIFNATAGAALVGADRNVLATDQSVVRQTQLIKATVARNFYSLAIARESVELAQQAVVTAEKQRELANRQVQAGLVPRRVLLQAELRLSQAERDVVRAREERTRATNGFVRSTGIQAPETLQWAGAAPALPESLEDALQRAKNGRADLHAERHRKRAARARTNAARLGWVPRLNGSFDLLYTENTGFLDQKMFWTGGIQATFSLWDGGNRLAQTRIAASEERSFEVNILSIEQQIKEEVEIAWDAHESASSATLAVEREVLLAEETHTLTLREFETGQATWLEVSQSELAVNNARLGALRTRMRLRLAEVSLLLATAMY